MRALAYLALRRFWNSLKRAPRDPRVLFPALLLLLVFGAILLPALLRHQGPSSPHVRHPQHAPMARPAAPPTVFRPGDYVTGDPGMLAAALRAILLINIFSAVVTALGDGSLFFTPADVDFLFPAPLSRRAVLLFKMLGRYAALLIPAVYLPLAFGGAALCASAGVSPVALWPVVIGMWLFYVAVANLTQAVLVGRSAPAADPAAEERAVRRRAALRRILVGAGIALVAGALLTGLHAVGASSPAAPGGDPADRLFHRLLVLLNGRVAAALLLPVTWAVDLLRVAFEGWSARTLGDLAGLLVLAAVSLLLLFMRERDFYEAALGTSERRTRLLSAMRGGDAGALLTQMAEEGTLLRGREVEAFGGGALAILWKDLIALTRTSLRTWGSLLFVAAFPAVIGVLVSGRRSDIAVLGWTVLFTLNMTNPFLLSLRDMLRRADLTKAMPIAPAKMLLGELATSVLQLTVLGWFSLGLMALAGVARGGPAVLVAAVTLPALAALLLFVQTCFVLLYPQQRGSGDAVQGGVAGLLGMVACTIALFPGLAAGLALYLAHVPASLLALGVAAADLLAAFVALQAAALLWQRFDPST